MTPEQQRALALAKARMAQKQAMQTQQSTNEPISGKEGALRSAVQGATFGFGDEIVAGLGALPQSAITGQPVSESYSQLLEQERQKIGRFREQSPWTSGLSEFAGGVGTGIAAAPAMGAKLLTQGGRIARGATAAGLGGISGGTYAFGTGEGGTSERLENVPMGSAFGAGGGLVGLGVSKAVRPLTERAKSLFSKKPAQAQIQTPKESLPISGKETLDDLTDIMERGQATDMLRGAKTQDVNLMRQEEMARQGLLGDELEKLVRGADEQFKQSVKNTAQALAGETGETSEDTLAKSIGLVKKRYDAQKRLQSQLMTKRNDAIAKAKVYKEYTKETLGNALDELRQTPDMKVNLQRADNKPVLDDLKLVDKMIKGAKDDINMSELAAWRSGLNSYQKGTQQSVLAGKAARVYDDWLDSELQLAIKEGDEDLAAKIFDANKRYSEFKNKYGTDKYKGQRKVVENILTQEDLSPRAMVNSVFGKSMNGTDYTSQYVKRMVESVPEGQQRDKVVQGFRAGLMQKAFENSFDDVTDTIKFGKFKNELIKMKKNDAFRDFLTTPGHTKVIDDLIVDLNKYQTATSDRSIVNLSGTTPMAARMMQSIGAIPVIRNISIARGGAEALGDIAKAGSRAKSKREVEKTVSEFYKTLAPEIGEQIKFNFAPAFVGGQAATPSMAEE